jgi:hypothetical protein
MNFINRSSINDLYNICNKLGLKNVYICTFKEEIPKILKNKKITNIIFNMGYSSHWCSINTTKKIYFDSYASYKPKVIPKDFKRASTNKELQSISSEMCGQLCCLWLYYINYKSNKQYYELFKDIY